MYLMNAKPFSNIQNPSETRADGGTVVEERTPTQASFVLATRFSLYAVALKLSECYTTILSGILRRDDGRVCSSLVSNAPESNHRGRAKYCKLERKRCLSYINAALGATIHNN